MMMEKEDIEDLLLAHNIRHTSNRVLIVRTLAMSGAPLSVKDFEKKLLTIDKSDIFRTLTLFKEHHLVHQIEEGNGMTAYELCLRHSHEEDDDVHVHFYCESCQHTFCLYNTPIPAIVVPNGFQVAGANYLVKGICPACAKKTKK